MKLLLVLVTWGFLIHAAKCKSYYYVLAPNIIRFDRDETIVVGLLEDTGANIAIWMERPDGKAFGHKSVYIANQERPVSVTMRVKEHDIIHDDMVRKPSFVTLVSMKDGQQKRRDIKLSYRTGHLVVQTDKPVYTPLQTVHVRVLPMDEDFKPARGTNVTIDIMSPSQVLFERKTMSVPMTGNSLIETELKLHDFIDTGIWSARAYYHGQLTTEGQALFAVEEYVLPTFSVEIAPETKYILQEDDTDIVIVVKARYVYDKPLVGSARIELTAINNSGRETKILESDRSSGELDNDGMCRFTITKTELCNRFNSACDEASFPVDSKLKIVATVTESPTGNKERNSDDSIVFVRHRYKVSFDRCKTNYRTGMNYHLAIDIKYANGDVAANKPTELKLFNKGSEKTTSDDTTDESGQVAFVITNLSAYEGDICFKVYIDDYIGDSFCVSPYLGEAMILAEHVIQEDGEQLRAVTNGRKGKDTGVLMMVISSGQVVHISFQTIGVVVPVSLTNDLKKKIKSKTARFLAFFIDMSHNKVVADAVKFEIHKECNGDGLTMESSRSELPPGDKCDLELRGGKMMYVGLNVMDSALLHVPNKQDILTTDKMYEVLDEHDIGCGEGSGVTAELVFKNTGMTILTNANINDNSIKRETQGCSGAQHVKKRSIENEDECAVMGVTFATNITETGEQLNADAVCLGKISKLSIELDSSGGYVWTTECLITFFDSCTETLAESTDGDVAGKSLIERNKYQSLIQSLQDQGQYNGQKFVREEFQESWLWEIRQLDHDGKKTVELKFPDSITTWLIQGIGITEDNGFCIAKSISVKAFKNFFVQVDLPYEATRLENIDIKATIFYYGSTDVSANVFLFHNTGYCSNAEPDQPLYVRVNLKPKSAETVRFQVIPHRQGSFDVDVRAIVFGATTQMDGVMKKLHVKNEGLEEKKAIEICLDPLQQQKDCISNNAVTTSYTNLDPDNGKQVSRVSLALREKYIPGTLTIVGRIKVNVMEEVASVLVKDVHGMLRIPGGCAFQNMERLGPTVYTMLYLRQTARMTNEFESKGQEYILNGIHHELKYRKSNGCYSNYASTPCPRRETKLTAYVAKVYCHARKIGQRIKDLVDNTARVSQTLSLLSSKSLSSTEEKVMAALAFMECKRLNTQADTRLVQLANELATVDTSNVITFAQVTYLLTLMNDERQNGFRERLMRLAEVDKIKDNMHWSSIVATSYALLATLNADDITTATRIACWLTSQRSFTGSYRSTRDSVIAVQALAEYTVKTKARDVNLKIKLRSQGWTKDLTLSPEKSSQLFTIDRVNELVVTTEGSGSARMMIEQKYNRPRRDDETCRLYVSDIEIASVNEIDFNLARSINRSCDICGNCMDDPGVAEQNNVDENRNVRRKREGEATVPTSRKCVRFTVRSLDDTIYETSMVMFSLQTGLEADRPSLDALKTSMPDVIDLIELPENGKNFITFYISKIDSNEIKFTFIMKDTYLEQNQFRQPARVDVFQYYNPDVKCTKFYNVAGKAMALRTKCNGRVCKCLQSECTRSDMKKRILDEEKPVLSLMSFTCDYNSADYAIRAKVHDVIPGEDGNDMTATATVITSIHERTEPLSSGSEIRISWRPECEYINDLFTVPSRNMDFYIIGRKPYKVESGNGRYSYVYELMKGAIVLRTPNNQNSRFARIMKNYEKFMEKKSCQQ